MIIYIVQAGDTLNLISRRFNIPVSEILKNNWVRDDLIIYPGQILFLPRRRDDYCSDNDGFYSPDKDDCYKDDCYSSNQNEYYGLGPWPWDNYYGGRKKETFYVVQRGDTLQIITSRFNTSVDAIVDANRMAGPSETIFPGQVIRVPIVCNRA
ncbi:MAG TPA: LysM peptidoglycan-binding domain-containing protein [Thermoanaerobacterales bacterium]|nr:LysM peptidoglycan-binding domain-containing protein [Thermoanaerobacterales bacterium]